MVPQLTALHIKRRRPQLRCSAHHLFHGDEHKHRLRVHELSDEPRTRHPVHLHLLSRNPFHDRPPSEHHLVNQPQHRPSQNHRHHIPFPFHHPAERHHSHDHCEPVHLPPGRKQHMQPKPNRQIQHHSHDRRRYGG